VKVFCAAGGVKENQGKVLINGDGVISYNYEGENKAVCGKDFTIKNA
jgi:hypothetical protein